MVFEIHLQARSSSSPAAVTTYLWETCHQRGPLPRADRKALPHHYCPAVGRDVVVEAIHATRDTSVDHAHPESFSYIPLPAPNTLAVSEAGSATLDTAGDHYLRAAQQW